MAEDFISKFNRLLGDRAGIPTQAPVMPTYSFEARTKASQMANRAKAPGKGTRPNVSLSKLPKKKKAAKGTLTDEQKRIAQVVKDYQERKVLEDALHNEESNIAERGLGALASGGGRALDILLRPVYAATEATRATSESINAGEPIHSLGDDAVMGAISGLWGTRKTTPGEIAEENAKRMPGWAAAATLALPFPFNMITAPLAAGEGANKLAETHPTAAQNYKRAAGLFGELFLDPYNVVSGGTSTILRKTGEVATEATVKKYVREAAEAAAKSRLPAKSKRVRTPAGTFGSATKNIGTSAEDAVTKTVLEVMGGAQAGKVRTGNIVPTVANATAESYRAQRLSPFERNLEKFAAHIDDTATMTGAQIEAIIASDPQFKIFWDDMLTRLNASRSKNPIRTWNELEKALNGKNIRVDGLVVNAANTARASIGDEVLEFMNHFGDQISKLTYNAPGVRFAGGPTIPFKRVGKAYSSARMTVGSRFAGDTANAFSYERKFPGRLSLITQKTKSMGVKAFEELEKKVRPIAKELTKEERKIVSAALDSGTLLTDPKLEQARQFIRAQYDEIFDREVEMGIRSAGERRDNFQFVFNQRGSKAARTKFKVDRKTASTKLKSLDGHRVADAKAAGLKPVEDPFQALLYKKMDSNRAMTRAWFKEDLIDHYGVLGKGLSPQEIIDRQLQPMKNNLSDKIKGKLGPADEWYLPKEMYKVLEEFNALTKLGSKESIALVKIFDNITNMFKFSATVPYPGFHVRNMVGDVFMGFLDGVRSPTYTELFTKIRKARNGHKTSFRITDDIHLTYDELNDLYMEHAAAGRFYSTDLNPSRLGGLPRRATDKLRDVSERREDFGRMAHFLHALREEVPAALKAGKSDAMKKATEAAIYRVNKYKFDYSALTAVEHHIKRLGMPFYTYSRKAIPTLLEALFLSPRTMGRAARFSGMHQGDNDKNWNPMLTPQYMREIGYATLTDEEEPWAVGADILPMPGALTKFDFSSVQDFARSMVAQANPMLAAAPELSAGEYAFNQRPIESPLDYLMSKIPPISAGKSLFGDKSISEQALSSRFALGLPIRKITSGQQEFAYQDMRDQLVDNPFKDFNKENENSGIRVYISKRNDGTSFQVRDTESDQVLYDTMNPKDALKFAERAVKAVVAERGELPEDPQFSRTLMNQLYG